MMKKILHINLAIVIGLVFAHISDATTIWVNPSNTGPSDGLTKATGYKTLWGTFPLMSPGDTVIIADGDWTTYPGMTIDSGGHLPPSGIDLSNMTTIRAENDWGVKLSKLDDQGIGRSYITIRGIVFLNRACMVYKWNYSKIIRCGFMGVKAGGNHQAFGLAYSTYNLIEECIAWGGGRYKFLDYQGHHNIFRRCVARHDWYISPEWAGQESNFRGYGAHDDVWQNCISIDSDRIEYQNPEYSVEDADFWVGDQTGAGNNIITGCIVIKGIRKAYYLAGTTSPTDAVELKNSIAIGPAQTQPAAIFVKGVIATVSSSFFYDKFTSLNPTTISNSIVRDVDTLYGTADYMCYYNTESGNYGEHSLNVDPFQNGLKYPVRIEPGSLLATAGSDGGPIGPNILTKTGRSGAIYGKQGWDEDTGELLWPWPNEDKIKELMSETVEGVPGIYGFTAYESPFGSPNTLTSYIWEYLGNPIPPEIYGAGNAPPAADDQSVSTDEDTPVVITLTGSDPDGDPLSYMAMSDPSNGSLSGEAPDLTYAPDPNYNSSDSFTFKVNDGTFDSNTATVSITVNPVNDVPVADDQSVATDENVPVSITLTGSDVDGNPLTYAVVTQTSNGSLSGTAPSLTYTPNAGYIGSDSFTFKINDGTVDSNIATVRITVNPKPLGQPGQPVHIDD